jgi:hypothetical protein
MGPRRHNCSGPVPIDHRHAPRRSRRGFLRGSLCRSMTHRTQHSRHGGRCSGLCAVLWDGESVMAPTTRGRPTTNRTGRAIGLTVCFVCRLGNVSDAVMSACPSNPHGRVSVSRCLSFALSNHTGDTLGWSTLPIGTRPGYRIPDSLLILLAVTVSRYPQLRGRKILCRLTAGSISSDSRCRNARHSPKARDSLAESR